MKKIVIILGTAHSANTSGKKSPDNQLKEYKYSRQICQQIQQQLQQKGYTTYIDIPQDNIPGTQTQELRRRTSIVNAICQQHGPDNCIYISIHINAAASDNKWHTAGGWTAYTTPGNTKADTLATYLYQAAQTHLKDYIQQFPTNKQQGHYDSKQSPIRTDYTDHDPDREARFYVLQHTKCPAVLTENLFQDNKADTKFLLSTKGQKAIIQTHLTGILNYINHINQQNQ